VPEFAAAIRPPTWGTYWRTLRHLRVKQLGYLAARRLGRGHRRLPVGLAAGVRMAPLPRRPEFPEWQPSVARHLLGRGEFRFLNTTVAWQDDVDWSAAGLPRLWAYNLNYFDFLNVDLTAPRDAALLHRAMRLAMDWCEANAAGHEAGWKPYPLSLRIVNWLKFLVRNGGAVEASGQEESSQRLLASLRVQTLVLERRLEKDLLANHLLKNIKALMFAGALIETSESIRWWMRGAKLLDVELKEQILPDGGHFERSPMYHAQVLEDLLDLQALPSLRGRTTDGNTMLAGKIGEMSRFLHAIVHPDGEIPLFNDSAFGGARRAKELFIMSGVSTTQDQDDISSVTTLADSGYGVIRDSRTQSCLIFDCGPLGPDYQPGHSHCDGLSFELSLHGQRVIVDTGVSTYEPGPERHYERSTAAHNTIRVDGEEQGEIWASFRLGRRPRVGQIRGGETGGVRWLRGEHYGYQRQGVTHCRVIIHTPQGGWIIVDSLEGTGIHRIESFVHFHPAVGIESFEGSGNVPAGQLSQQAAIRVGGRSYFVMTAGDGNIAFEDSYYAPEFGRRLPQKVLHWIWERRLPIRMVSALVPAIKDQALPAISFLDKAVEINGVAVPLQ
jgi:uncharacterized heparinase superfamily protein